MFRTTISVGVSLLLTCCVLSMRAQQTPETEAPPSTPNTVTGSGTPQFVPLWLTKTNLGTSSIFQKGNRVAVGTKTPTAQVDVVALTLIPAFSALGASAPAGSDQNASDGASSKGGDADPDSGFSVGGVGVVGTGGASSLFAGSAGPGGMFTGGSGGSGSAFGGVGVVGTGGASSSGAGPGGVFTGGMGGGDGIDASCTGTGCLAGNFTGNLHVSGKITAGTKDFKIDHPLDPANKYLVHSSVESAEMKNLYDGTVILDENGEAIVQLPAWFEAMNSNFRYQLTALGAPSPGLYIAEKISQHHLKIAGGKPGAEVSWQVTGVRQDAYARANPLVVEEQKQESERGYYIHPELYGAPEEKGIEWAHNMAWMLQVQKNKAAQLAHNSNRNATESTGAITSAFDVPSR